jgi:hypothetical protein
MKQIFLLIFISYCTIAIAQVPEPPREMRIDADKPNIKNENASYYLKNGKYGFVLENNRQEAVYEKITYGINGFIVQKGKLYGIANNKGLLLNKVEFDSIGILKSNYLVKQNGKYGLLSDKGISLLPSKYNKIFGRNNLVSIVQGTNGKVQLIFNETGKVFNQDVEYVNLYYNLAIVKSNGKFGVITDKIIVPFKYDSIAHNISNVTKSIQKQVANNVETNNVSRPPIFDFMVLENNKLGLINSEGAIIYPPENDEIKRETMFAYYLIKKENLYSIYFTSSKTKTAFNFSRIYADGYGYVMAVQENKAGAFNLTGELIVPFEYDDDFIAQYSGIGLRVTKNKKRGVIDTKGKIIVPVIYDDVSTLYNSNFKSFIKVKSDNKEGVINLKGELIIPVEFEWIGVENDFFKVITPNQKVGLYDKNGKMIVPAEYQWISKSETENSKIIILKKEDKSYNFLNPNNELVLPENISAYGYILDENLLLNPFASNNNYLLYIKSQKGKFGMLNEMAGVVDIPMIYDTILQRFEAGEHTYFSVQKGNKFGLINEKNEIIIPIKYNDININSVVSNYDKNYQIVIAKGKKYGTVNLQNEIQIPFQYTELQRIADIELYKAKKKGHYQIINAKNQPINDDLYDEVANFEQKGGFEYGDKPSYQALTFRNGKMRVIDEKGNYLTTEIAMKPHSGFQSFDELKLELIKALNNNDDVLLKEFVDKIAPSEHILYYLKNNMFTNNTLDYVDISYIKEKYYTDLLQFKHSYWSKNSGMGYKRTSLTEVTDYTLYNDGFITNKRNTDHAFGNVKYLEKILRNAIKINGFWISSYFMKQSF